MTEDSGRGIAHEGIGRRGGGRGVWSRRCLRADARLGGVREGSWEMTISDRMCLLKNDGTGLL